MFVEHEKIGRVVTDLSGSELVDAVRLMMDAQENANMRKRAAALKSANGADRAAEVICGFTK